MAAITGVVGIARWLNGRKANHDLHHHFTTDQIAQAKRWYVQTKLQKTQPITPAKPPGSKTRRTNGLRYFRKRFSLRFVQPSSQFHLILAESGMGKTMFLIALFREHCKRFILSKPNIHLFSLGRSRWEESLATISPEQRGNAIILLDAFDEDLKLSGDWNARLDNICAQVSDFRRVVITCRTQFFPSVVEIPTSTHQRTYAAGAEQLPFNTRYISPFTTFDIYLYLFRRFNYIKIVPILKGWQIIKATSDLMARPMLLAHIDTLIKGQATYENTAQVYAAIIRHWIDYEKTKIDNEALKKEYAQRLRQFSKELAVHLWRRRSTSQGFQISRAEIDKFAQSHAIDISLLGGENVTNRSLLTRIEAEYEFAHKSILEFLLADAAFENLNLAKDLRDQKYDRVPQTEAFLRQLVGSTYPTGRRYTRSWRDLIRECENHTITSEKYSFLFVEDEKVVHVMVWDTTPPHTVDTFFSQYPKIKIHICYSGGAFSDSMANDWANLAKSSLIHEVHPQNVNNLAGARFRDTLRGAFNRLRIDVKLKVN